MNLTSRHTNLSTHLHYSQCVTYSTRHGYTSSIQDCVKHLRIEYEPTKNSEGTNNLSLQNVERLLHSGRCQLFFLLLICEADTILWILIKHLEGRFIIDTLSIFYSQTIVKYNYLSEEEKFARLSSIFLPFFVHPFFHRHENTTSKIQYLHEPQMVMKLFFSRYLFFQRQNLIEIGLDHNSGKKTTFFGSSYIV